ncbi:MAG: hypothetical protein R6U19_02480 [Bacteroidales bacterium]
MESSIRLKDSQKETWRIEQFAEEIADQYNIFNSYYGNILVSLVECADIKQPSSKDIQLDFRSERNGLIFTFRGDYSHLRPEDDLIFLISKLSDHYSFDNESITIAFSINSINKELSTKRKDIFTAYLQGVAKEQKENKNG